jgi:hypothetical protein
MPELTLENLAARVEMLEKEVAEQRELQAGRKKDWRRTVGMFAGSDFIKTLDAEVAIMREAEREAARSSEPE